MVALLLDRLRTPPTDLRSPFSREPLPIYILVFAQFSIGLALFRALGFRFYSGFEWGAAIPAILIAGGWSARRISFDRLANTLEAFGLFALFAMSGVALAIALTATPVPLADDLLASFDRALGIEFPTVVSSVPHATKLPLMWAYASFKVQPLILLAALFLSGRRVDGWRLLCALTIALMLTLAIYPLVPALAAYHHFGVMPDSMFGTTAIDYVPAIEAIRGGDRLITPNMLVGYVTFPSFHAAGATVFAWGAWQIRWLRVPGLVLNAVMAFSTIPVGGHYAIDVPGGVLVACLSIWLGGKIYRGSKFGLPAAPLNRHSADGERQDSRRVSNRTEGVREG